MDSVIEILPAAIVAIGTGIVATIFVQSVIRLVRGEPLPHGTIVLEALLIVVVAVLFVTVVVHSHPETWMPALWMFPVGGAAGVGVMLGVSALADGLLSRG